MGLLGELQTRGGHALQGKLAALSDREFQVFGLLGRCLKPTRIACELGVSIKTVETHQRRIREKLAFRRGSEVIRCAERWATSLSMGSLNDGPAQMAGRRVAAL
jgi:DNA-binding NarL/FixJ family response regulator